MGSLYILIWKTSHRSCVTAPVSLVCNCSDCTMGCRWCNFILSVNDILTITWHPRSQSHFYWLQNTTLDVYSRSSVKFKVKLSYIWRAPSDPPKTTMVFPMTEEEWPAIGGGPCVVTIQFHLTQQKRERITKREVKFNSIYDSSSTSFSSSCSPVLWRRVGVDFIEKSLWLVQGIRAGTSPPSKQH